jgi:hypothetical protein
MTPLSQYPDRGWDEPGREWGPGPKKRGLGAGAKIALTLAGVVGGLGGCARRRWPSWSLSATGWRTAKR